jgi:hypothetical protein
LLAVADAVEVAEEPELVPVPLARVLGLGLPPSQVKVPWMMLPCSDWNLVQSMTLVL